MSSQLPAAVSINVSPALKRFDRPLLRYLAPHLDLVQWDYRQTPDEPMCLTTVLDLLHDYLHDLPQPVHLIGHGTSGLVAGLYARRYPDRVRSLTLLAVGVYPAVDWQLQYYSQLQRLPCSRSRLLAQTALHLFGPQSRPMLRELVQVLDHDLMTAFSPHTLYRQGSFIPAGVGVPLLVCGSLDDSVVDPNLLHGWQPFLQPTDRLWATPTGRHFFHYHQPHAVGEQILDFWEAQPHLHPTRVAECRN